MRTHLTLKRSLIFAGVLSLVGAGSVPVLLANPSVESTHQYQLGTFGEGCYGTCGERHICCEIVIVNDQ